VTVERASPARATSVTGSGVDGVDKVDVVDRVEGTGE
jgi:hypothetical protein